MAVSAEYVGVPRSTGEFVVRDVTVVDVADGSRCSGLDIRISGGTITEIGAVGQNAAGVTVVDGAGAFVVPGYVDAHAHALNDPGRVAGAYALMLANGITGFRQLSGSPKLLKDRKAGRLPAPPGAPALLATAGTLLTPLNSATPADAAAEVRAQHEQGADFIKAGLTSRDSFLAALSEATRVGMPLAGHLPGDVDPREAARGGMRASSTWALASPSSRPPAPARRRSGRGRRARSSCQRSSSPAWNKCSTGCCGRWWSIPR
jgi:imidazolonepropionase-like amidohydrolase